MNTHSETTDLIVFSHLRWDFVLQRPQHLLSRYAKYRRVFYFEEPLFGVTDMPRLHLRETAEGVQVAVPYLPSNIKADDVEAALRDLVDELIFEEDISRYSVWYFSPKALPYSRHLAPVSTIYDKMDELSLFRDPILTVKDLEDELLKRSDLVFAGGLSLYESIRNSHPNVHPFPSSLDYDHFSQARLSLVEPDDQVNIPHPRLGFYGIIDERFHTELLKEMAEKRPDWHFIVIGPVVRIDPDVLPKASNIHYLGKKDYHALPLYLSGWDCAIMPFVLNEATEFISPAKTNEFLAAGKPVVSTPIRDVVNQYGKNNLVHIAGTAEEFLIESEEAMKVSTDPHWIQRVDEYLTGKTWDETFIQMARLEKELTKKPRDQVRIERVVPTPISAGEVL